MSDFLDRLREEAIQFRVELNKYTLSRFILDEIAEIDSNLSKHELLNKKIETEEDIKNLKRLFDKNKGKLANGLHNYCIEEYKEIKDDYKWRKSRKGQEIMVLDEWVLKTRMVMSDKLGDHILIGRNINEPSELIIGGVVEDHSKIGQIIEYFDSLKPPADPTYRFEIKEN